MTTLNYAFYTENFEIYQFHFKTYGHGVWYDENKEDYSQAIERARAVMYKKVQDDNPHLVFFGGNPVRETQSQQDFHENTIANIDNPLPETTETKIINQIYGCTDLKVLESFKLLASRYPAVKEAYEQQFKTLSND